MTILEALEYGPIVAKSDDYGLFVTANGSYLNLWTIHSTNDVENICARPLGNEMAGLNGLQFLEVVGRAEEFMHDRIAEYDLEETEMES